MRGLFLLGSHAACKLGFRNLHGSLKTRVEGEDSIVIKGMNPGG